MHGREPAAGMELITAFCEIKTVYPKTMLSVEVAIVPYEWKIPNRTIDAAAPISE